MADTILRDFRHAARLFVDDQFRLAPKHNFLFHVAFSINPAACKDGSLVQRHKNEINMLVKSADLPNFSVKIDTLNQYNRKRNIQTTHEYQPINISFHDDNMGLINKVWQNYYNYYYADPSSAEDAGAYDKNATKNFSYVKNTYGLDNGSMKAFFKYIKIYQMARREYVCYKLHNPIITSWNHNKVDYSSGDVHDNLMQIKYEAVSYTSGKVASGDPEGFGVEHYDKTPSPNKGGKGGSQSPGTKTGSQSPSFSNSLASNSKEAYANLTQSINTYQNTGQLPIAGTTGIVTSTTLGQTAKQAVGGLQGLTFPTSKVPSNTITASLIKLT